MPRKPKKPCKHPGCTKLTEGFYCEEHESLHRDDRAGASNRGYNRMKFEFSPLQLSVDKVL